MTNPLSGTGARTPYWPQETIDQHPEPDGARATGQSHAPSVPPLPTGANEQPPSGTPQPRPSASLTASRIDGSAQGGYIAVQPQSSGQRRRLEICSVGTSETPLITAFGQSQRLLLTLGKIPLLLDQIFGSRASAAAREPGRLSHMIAALSPQAREGTASARLTLAVFTARAVEGVDLLTERRVVEMGILGQAEGFFHNNNCRMIKDNGFAPTQDNIATLGRETVDLYVQSGLISASDTVIDIGTGMGYVPKFLAECYGVKVEAVDSTQQEVPAFKQTHRCSSEAFVRDNPGRQFSVVNVCNISPKSPAGERYLNMSSLKRMIGDLAALTKETGHALVGISSIDPQFASGVSEYRLRPHLAAKFGKVEYLSAKRLEPEGKELFSIGGQLGVFKCSLPKRV